MPDGKDSPNVASLFAQLARVFKAIPSEKLEDVRDVKDLWTDEGEHRNPSREELGPFGPEEPMSGGNATPMVRRYSDLSAQVALTRQYEQLSGMFGRMSKAHAALAGVVSDMVTSQKSLGEQIEGFLKSETDRQVAAEEAAKKAVQPTFSDETYTGNALKRFEKARRAFRKSEFADESERETRKGLLEEAMSALKSARTLLTKAEDAAEDPAGETTEKALADIKELSARVTKAQTEITKAEDDDREEEKKREEESKKAEEVVKDKGGEGDDSGTKKNTEEEKDDDTAKKAETLAELQAAADRLEKAAEGNEIMTTSLKGFMDIFMNASRSALPPNFQMVKAQPVVDIARRVENAKDAGILATVHECTLADSLLNRQQMTEKGQYPKEKWHEDLLKAPETVRQLFIEQRPAA